MTTVLKICFAIAAGLEFVFVPQFLKASKNGRCTKSQILKTVCATLFVAAGVLASAIAQNQSSYAHYILIGLLLGWCGDFLLHLPPKPPFALSGGLAFLAGHVFYIYAYCLAMKHYFSDAQFWDKHELIACAVIIVIGLAVLRLLGVKFSPLYLIGVPYVAMLAFMLVKAGSLGFKAVAAGLDNAVVMCILLVGGAFLFALSDMMLAVNSLRKPRPPYGYKITCIITYFTAQFLLASTIFVISA